MIDSFRGQYYFLSNFYYPSRVIYEDWIYVTVEHAFQAAKTNDFYERIPIFLSLDPTKAKQLGRLVTLREDWEEVKDEIMYNLVTQKFTQSNYLKRKLLETHPQELIEGNWWGDTYWGVCRGVGQNKLGKILMEVREHECL